MHPDEARTLGGLTWPHEDLSMRLEIDEAMNRVAEVYQECRQSFTEVFGRDPGDVIEAFATDDAETVIIASGTMTTTCREVVRRRRAEGEKVGLVKVKMYRPYPEIRLREACRAASKLAVLDRNYAAGSGGVFWQDTRAAFQGHRDDLLIQNYLTGLCGGDVTPAVIDEILTDITTRSEADKPVWLGIETGEETLQ
jgi:pyruvate ferredoxin oxidoreductase alpha subunit